MLVAGLTYITGCLELDAGTTTVSGELVEAGTTSVSGVVAVAGITTFSGLVAVAGIITVSGAGDTVSVVVGTTYSTGAGTTTGFCLTTCFSMTGFGDTISPPCAGSNSKSKS